jgi:hypoxanthine phosphoribosyltransferase
MADLARKMTAPVKMDFIRLASYGSETQSSGKVKITKDLETPLRGKDVLVVEDIIDTGITLQHLLQRLRGRQPRSLKVVTLLDKPGRRKVDLQADYVGFQIENHFVVGYGLDCAEEYRNLRGIYVLEKDSQ